MILKPIEGAPGLVKDMDSGAVLNIDNNSLAVYRKRKAVSKSQHERLENLENSLGELKGDLDDIKKLLAALVGK